MLWCQINILFMLLQLIHKNDKVIMICQPPLHYSSAIWFKSRRIIYQPSSFAMQNLLYLQETGSLTAIKPHTSSRQNLSSFLFFYVVDGEGSLTYQNQIYSMKKGDCAFIDCRKKYSQSSSSKNLWSLKWVHFYGSTMSEIYSKYLERGGEACFSAGDGVNNPFFSDSRFDYGNGSVFFLHS